MRIIDYQGKKYGKLTAVSFTGKYYTSKGSHRKRIWLFNCDCGNQTERLMEKVVRGWVKSCGCLRADQCWGVESIKKQVFREGYADGDLTLDEFVFMSQQPCYWCGQWSPSTRKAKSNKTISWDYHGLDRINNDLPHNRDNLVSCCWGCNSSRGNKTIPQWIEHIQAIYNNRIRGSHEF